MSPSLCLFLIRPQYNHHTARAHAHTHTRTNTHDNSITTTTHTRARPQVLKELDISTLEGDGLTLYLSVLKWLPDLKPHTHVMDTAHFIPNLSGEPH